LEKQFEKENTISQEVVNVQKNVQTVSLELTDLKQKVDTHQSQQTAKVDHLAEQVDSMKAIVEDIQEAVRAGKGAILEDIQGAVRAGKGAILEDIQEAVRAGKTGRLHEGDSRGHTGGGEGR
jgi:archaellum component FlaC